MNDRHQIVVGGRPLLRARRTGLGARVGRRRLARRPRGGRRVDRYEDGRLVGRGEPPLPGPTTPPRSGPAKLAPDNCAALSVSGDVVRLIDLGCFQGGAPRWFKGVYADWSPDGKWIAVAEPDAVVFHRVVGGEASVRWDVVAGSSPGSAVDGGLRLAIAVVFRLGETHERRRTRACRSSSFSARNAVPPNTHGSPRPAGREHTAATPPSYGRAPAAAPPSPAPDRQTVPGQKPLNRGRQTGRLLSHGAHPFFSAGRRKATGPGVATAVFRRRSPLPLLPGASFFVVATSMRQTGRAENTASRRPSRTGAGTPSRRDGRQAPRALSAARRQLKT